MRLAVNNVRIRKSRGVSEGESGRDGGKKIKRRDFLKHHDVCVCEGIFAALSLDEIETGGDVAQEWNQEH